MKTSELTGAALDWAVAKCEGRTEPEVANNFAVAWYTWGNTHYSTDWAQGGPIIERGNINVIRCDTDYQSFPDKWMAEAGKSAYCESTEHQQHAAMIQFGIEPDGRWGPFFGPTPLIAAMRCYVASKLGAEVEIPKELK